MKFCTIKTLMGLVSIFVSFSYLSALEYRLAGEIDLPQLLSLYERIEMDDQGRNNLVIFPRPIRENALRDAISKRRLFVACEKQNIVSLLKMFVIDDHNELHDILHHEVRALGANARSEGKSTYLFCHDHNFFTQPLQEQASECDHELPQDGRYLYYGAAYTIPEHRGKAINSTLMSFALNTVARASTPSAVDTLVLLYGQARININHKSMVRAFAQHIAQQGLHDGRDFLVVHERFKAYKPEFVLDNERLEVLPDCERNRGYGNVLIFDKNGSLKSRES